MASQRDDPGPPPRLLVVDDERPIREMLELGLRSRGFEVRSAPDGPAALPLVREWKPEVILLDVMLPKIDGLSLLPQLRRLTEAPIVMLSAKGEVDDRVLGLDRGADDYIAKPFEMSELVARLRSALRRPRLEHVEVITYADVEVELQTRTVHRGGGRWTSRRSNTICWSRSCAIRGASSRATNCSIWCGAEMPTSDPAASSGTSRTSARRSTRARRRG